MELRSLIRKKRALTCIWCSSDIIVLICLWILLIAFIVYVKAFFFFFNMKVLFSAVQLRSHVENLAALSKCNPQRRSKVKVCVYIIWQFCSNLCNQCQGDPLLQELSSEVVDSNPYSRLMALQRMGIVENYERIREFSVAIVVCIPLPLSFFSMFFFLFIGSYTISMQYNFYVAMVVWKTLLNRALVVLEVLLLKCWPDVVQVVFCCMTMTLSNLPTWTVSFSDLIRFSLFNLFGISLLFSFS